MAGSRSKVIEARGKMAFDFVAVDAEMGSRIFIAFYQLSDAGADFNKFLCFGESRKAERRFASPGIGVTAHGKRVVCNHGRGRIP